MTEPLGVDDDVVRAIHHRQLTEHGGQVGIRDKDLLASALAKPQNLLAYATEPPDIPRLAASYAFGIAKNHPFVDGNKRTAYVVSFVFLRMNGFTVDASNEEKYLTFLRLAEGILSEEQLAAWFKSHSNTA